MSDATPLAIAAPERRPGLWPDAWARLRRDRAAVTAGTIATAIVLLALVGPALSPHSAEALDWQHMAVPPQVEHSHWLGTDRLGRDLFVRALAGVRISLAIALLAALVSGVIGIGWGALAGFAGGRLDALMMRFVDVLYSLPYVLFVIVLTTLFERGSVAVIFIALAAVGWLTMARVVRAQTLSLRRQEFVEAALAIGSPTHRIVLRHIVPNVAGPALAYATLAIPQLILLESFLSFLGLGVQEPLASLGSLINAGAREMQSAPWMLLVPSTFLVALLACVSTLGDALRDALDVRRT